MDQGEGQHERAVSGPRTRMSTSQLLETRQHDRCEIVRLQFAEKLFEEFLVVRQLDQKVFRGPRCDRAAARCVVIRQKRLQNLRRQMSGREGPGRRGQGPSG